MAPNGDHPDAFPQNTIVVAVDNAQACRKAVTWAKERFSKDHILHLLHVQTNASSAAFYIGNGDAGLLAYECEEAHNKEREEKSENFLHSVFIPLASEGGWKVAATMLHVDSDGSSAIGAAICNYCEKHKPSALVMMKENKSGFTRFFVGSVTKYVAIHCQVPLIIVPETEPTK